MVKLIFTVVFCVSVSFADSQFSPPLTDTAAISCDPMGLSSRYSVISNFSFVLPDGFSQTGSETWLIDGQPPVAGDVTVNDFPKVSFISISPQAMPKFAGGIHTVQVHAQFGDSVINAKWYFRYFETQYKEIRATVLVDSSWNIYDQSWETFTRYKLLSVLPVDTQEFGNSQSSMDSTSVRLLNFDTAGIMREYLSEVLCKNSPAKKDTLDCMIIQILRGDARYNEWLISPPVDTFIKQSNPSFPISDALRFFNLFADANNLPRGYFPQKGDFKLGPVFKFGAGDPGWSLHAFNDASAWYFVHKIGSGDCPCGCTEWTITTYRVTADGTVAKFADAVQRPVRLANDKGHVFGAMEYYNIKGQLVGSAITPGQKRCGVYITSYKGACTRRATIRMAR